MARPGMLILLAALSLSACAEPSGFSDDDQPYRLILRLTDPTLDPAAPEVLQQLSRRAGAELVYLRPLTGGSHLLAITDSLATERGEGILQRLREIDSVSSAEVDARRYRQELD